MRRRRWHRRRATIGRRRLCHCHGWLVISRSSPEQRRRRWLSKRRLHSKTEPFPRTSHHVFGEISVGVSQQQPFQLIRVDRGNRSVQGQRIWVGPGYGDRGNKGNPCVTKATRPPIPSSSGAASNQQREVAPVRFQPHREVQCVHSGGWASPNTFPRKHRPPSLLSRCLGPVHVEQPSWFCLHRRRL